MLFVKMADEAHPIGPAPARESYLVVDRIIEAARRSGAAAIHPGYGFLSERAEFAEACAANGIVFVGPPASSIRAIKLKDAAKALVLEAGVPVVPGYHGARQEPDFLRQKADEIGYPVLIKAVAGGGGKGMRRVDGRRSSRRPWRARSARPRLRSGSARARREIRAVAPAHRDPGLRRRARQRRASVRARLLAAAPPPEGDRGGAGARHDGGDARRDGRAAVEAARAVGYVGAGTVEFIADGREGLRPRPLLLHGDEHALQVEHPVTEAITGLDLVELQFRVAAGERLPFAQGDLAIDGHAVEARLYAEDPEREFLPSTRQALGARTDGARRHPRRCRRRGGDEVTPSTTR